MKKLKLKALALGSQEVLTREQLKNVSGGFGLFWECDCVNGDTYLCTGTYSTCTGEASSKCGAGQTATCYNTSGIL